MLLLFFVVVLFITQTIAEVNVLKTTQYIYENSPLNANGQAPLIADKDYLLTKDPDGDGLILKLLKSRQWTDLSPPVTLILSSLTFKGNNKNLIQEPMRIAHVLKTPTVHESTRTILQTSYTLIINGFGFIGSQAVNFYFQPPLLKGDNYEDVTEYPLRKDQIVLSLRRGYTWRVDEGPLKIIGVDTGGGLVKMGGDEGVVVAKVVKNPSEAYQITVDKTLDHQFIYVDEPNVVVTGSGFHSDGNVLRFTNGLLGSGVNFTMSSSDSMITLYLVPGSLWRKDFENLPCPLTVLAVNVGSGYVAVGHTNPRRGRGSDIAMVFERPKVFPNHKSIHRTHSRELHIKGTGFPETTSAFIPMLKFSPPLIEGVDYALRVVNRTDLKVTLLNGKAWAPPLKGQTSLFVVEINTRGDDAGWVNFDGEGVHVALVVRDVGIEESSGSEVVKKDVQTNSELSRLAV
eukprot:gene15713-17642_t